MNTACNLNTYIFQLQQLPLSKIYKIIYMVYCFSKCFCCSFSHKPDAKAINNPVEWLLFAGFYGSLQISN